LLFQALLQENSKHEMGFLWNPFEMLILVFSSPLAVVFKSSQDSGTFVWFFILVIRRERPNVSASSATIYHWEGCQYMFLSKPVIHKPFFSKLSFFGKKHSHHHLKQYIIERSVIIRFHPKALVFWKPLMNCIFLISFYFCNGQTHHHHHLKQFTQLLQHCWAHYLSLTA